MRGSDTWGRLREGRQAGDGMKKGNPGKKKYVSDMSVGACFSVWSLGYEPT